MKLLTPREKEVLYLLKEGLNNQEIAERLCISRHTTKAHLSSIYKKCEVKNRVLAVKHILNESGENKN